MAPATRRVIEKFQLQTFSGEAGERMDDQFEGLRIPATPYGNLLAVRQKAHTHTITRAGSDHSRRSNK